MRKGFNLKLIIALTVFLALIFFSWNQPFQVFTHGACRFGKPTEGCIAYFPKFNILPFLGNLLPRIIILFPILFFLEKKRLLTLKNIILGLIGLIVIILAVYFGSIYYQQYRSNQISQEPAHKLETTTITNQQKIVTNHETANWEVYKNSNYNFSIKHPLDFIVDPSDKNNLVSFMSLKDPSCPTSQCDRIVTINVKAISNDSINQVIEQMWSSENMHVAKDFQQITIGGENGLISINGIPAQEYGQAAYVIHLNKLYTIGLYAHGYNVKDNPGFTIFKQMLSTFKFLN